MTFEAMLEEEHDEARKEEKRELVKALRVQGKLTLAEIASVSGLTPEEIKEL